MAPQPNFCKCSGEGEKCGNVDPLCGDGLDVLILLEMGCEPYFMRLLCCVHLVFIQGICNHLIKGQYLHIFNVSKNIYDIKFCALMHSGACHHFCT